MNAVVQLQSLAVPAFEPEHLVYLDFETYWDKNYNLDKLTTSDYVSDPRFEVLGAGVRIDDGETVWMEEPEFRAWSRTWDWSGTAVCAHHSHFDGLICTYHYGFAPGLWLCTLSMSRGLGLPGSLAVLSRLFGVGEKGAELLSSLGKHRADFTPEEWSAFGLYCIQDVDLMAGIFSRMSFPDSELWVIDATIRLFTEPQLVVDEAKLYGFIEDEKKRKEELLARVGMTRKTTGSNPRLAKAFAALGIEAPMKPSPTSKKRNSDGSKIQVYAFAKTDAGMQELLEHEDEDVRLLAEARVAVKSGQTETRGERYLRMGAGGRPLPVYLVYCGAHTTRWTAADKTQFQNLEKVSKKNTRKGMIKRSLCAIPGRKIVAADSGAIEARGTAWLAGHDELVEAFRQNRDVYSEFASIPYGRVIDRKKNPEDEIPGFLGKICLAGETPVLTRRGWVRITDVRLEDRVWDGIEWVGHRGLLDRGIKEVLEWNSVAATPDHEILTERGWREWQEVLANPSLFRSALKFLRHVVSLPTGNLAELTPERKKTGNVSKRRTRTYDLLSAGPLRRFTIRSSQGPLLVSNCVLGLGYQLGWAGLSTTLLRGAMGGPPVTLTAKDAVTLGVDVDRFASDEKKVKRVQRMITRLPLEELAVHCACAENLVQTYRRVNKPIKDLWKKMETILDVMTEIGESEQVSFGPNDCLTIIREGIILPNGLVLRYPELRKSKRVDEDGEETWGSNYSYRGRYNRTHIYGGALTENVIQAVSRVVISEQMLSLRAKYGYEPALITHDEIATIVDDAEAPLVEQRMVEEMRIAPAWAKGWPLNAEGGFAQNYGDA